MIVSYLKITLRHLWRYKVYSFINIFGLAMGLACALLIMLWVQDELSFDEFHSNSENLYQIEQDVVYDNRTYHLNITSWPCVPAWKEEVPEVINATRTAFIKGRSFRYEEQAFIESDVMAVDPDFFTMFDFNLLQGEQNSVLLDPFSVVIDEGTALKYFGQKDPMGEVLTVDTQFSLTVTGVIERAPRNSSIKPVILVSIDFAKDLGEYDEGWSNNLVRSYALLHNTADLAEVNRKLTEVVNNHQDDENKTKYMANLLTRVHLYEYWGFDDHGQEVAKLYMFSLIAGFVLLIAGINFMNLSTARSANRAREIGIRKVVGAYRKNLIFQFLGESILLTCFAAILSLGFIYFLLPILNSISGKLLSASVLFQTDFILGLIGITLITGLFAGSYPALFLSSYRPVDVLKGGTTQGSSQAFRKALVILQFTLSISLIIATMIIHQQLNYSRSKDLGYDKENIISVSINGDKRNSYEALRKELLQSSQILGITASSNLPTNIRGSSDGVDWDGKDPNQKLPVFLSAIDYDYVETMKIQMHDGRSFSRDFGSDATNDEGGGAFMINEEFAKIMGEEPVVNKTLHFVGIKGPVVGVMKDFHFKSMRQKIEPLAIFIAPEWYSYVLIRLAPGDATQSLAVVAKAWDRVYPGIPFEFDFLAQDYEMLYRADKAIGQLIKYLAILAVIIAYLGLYGLASYAAEQRKKEIGIRKVLGASMGHLIYLLTSQFTKWVIISCAIAFPLAHYGLSKYLQGFAYRIELGPVPFLIAGVMALFIALITVSYQAARASLANPVDSLKYE